ncbi:MAG TPA: hypothetical protein VN258_18220 [Mobilitalea sp.]|nr:hypothetical protein [Mobilitalea sp.]
MREEISHEEIINEEVNNEEVNNEETNQEDDKALKQQAIINAITQFLTEEDWNYTFDDKKNIFKTGISIGGKIKDILIYILIEENVFMAHAKLQIYADDDNKQAVSEFITRANFGLKNGNFEMDYSDGEIRYKVFVNCNSFIPSQELIKESILTPAVMFDSYGSGLLAVMFGVKTPAEAIEEVESKL